MSSLLDPVSFVAIDFETANAKRDSAIAIGMARVEMTTRKIHRFYSLIKPPPGEWSHFNAAVHGLKQRDVMAAKTWVELWPEVSTFFDGVPIFAAHNAAFDKSVFAATCLHYGITPPEYVWECTVRLAKRLWPKESGHKLDACARRIGQELKHHHAGSDAEACARLVLWARNNPPKELETKPVARVKPIEKDRDVAPILASLVDNKKAIEADAQAYFDDPKAKKKKTIVAATVVVSTPEQIAAFACGPIHEVRGRTMIASYPLDDAARRGDPDGKWSKPTSEFEPEFSLTTIDYVGVSIDLEHGRDVQPPPAIEMPNGEAPPPKPKDRWAAKRHGSEGIPRTHAVVAEQIGNFDPPARKEFLETRPAPLVVTLESVQPCSNRVDGKPCGEVRTEITRGNDNVRCPKCGDVSFLKTRKGPRIPAARAGPAPVATAQRPLF